VHLMHEWPPLTEDHHKVARACGHPRLARWKVLTASPIDARVLLLAGPFGCPRPTTSLLGSMATSRERSDRMGGSNNRARHPPEARRRGCSRVGRRGRSRVDGAHRSRVRPVL